MAETEDFGDCESIFLDSMLEVEMTEEEGEVKISQTDDSSLSNERDLPPIPRFDLQSETLLYKDVYSNSVTPTKPANVIRTVPAPMPGTTIAVPVIQSAPMIVIHSNLLKSNNVTIKPSNVQTVVAKPSSVFKTLSTKDVGNQDLADDFMKRIFDVNLVKKVYKEKDELSGGREKEEENYYKSVFVDVSKVQLCRLHCTICDKHLGCGKNIEKKICIHNMLKVLTCKLCHEFYGDGNFPCDDGDHCEIYCRWCGQGGALICCSFCPKVFCKRCVRRNYNRTYLKAVEKASEWACFVCAQRPLWPHRAICRALVEYAKLRRTDVKIKDTSVCCKPSLVNKKIVTAVERNKIFLSGGQTFQMKTNERESEKKQKFVTPIPTTVTGNGHIIVKNLTNSLQLNDQTKTQVTVVSKGQIMSPSATSKITNSSSLNKNNKTNSVPKLSSLSGVNIPMINTPVYHGQTLITPPKNNSLQKKLNKEDNSSTVRVTVADYVNVDINKIPVAKIPPYVQGVILRLNFPDNKVQLVRLVKEGGEERPNFPIPVFENSENLDFLEGSLEDSFKLTKMLFERLMKIKEKLNSTTKVTKESVYKSSVKKLSFIYEKARELMKELDDNLLNNYELWKNENEQEKEFKVIELSDDDGNATGKQQTSIFDNRRKIFTQDDDSDIEVIGTGKMQNTQRILRSSKRSPAFRLPRKPLPGKPSQVKPSQVKPSPGKPTQVKPSPGKPTQVKLSPGKSSLPKSSPELVDLSRYAKKKRSVGRPRKRLKLSEEAAEIVEKDPLAVSDTEPEVNGQGKDSFRCDSGTFTSAIEIKEENLCFL